jgi:hypothetical protein
MDNNNNNYYYYYGPVAPLLGLGSFSSVSSSYIQSAGLLGRGISPSQGLYLHTTRQTEKQADIHVSSGIRTQDCSV